jgi:hypothetical protein
MNTISPKALFLQAHKDKAEELSKIVLDTTLRHATVFALAEMANERGVTQEQLDGAKRFVDILINLGEPPQKQPEFPDRTLKTI